jgi:hypothetical protein
MPSFLRLRACAALVVVATVAAACREAEPPLFPADRMKKARAADERGDTAARDAHLRVLAAGADEHARVATTWLFQEALSRREVVAALPLLQRIVETFGGRGVGKTGVPHLQDTLAPVLVAESAIAARLLVEGPTPDVAKAEAALDVGRRAAALGAVDDEDRALLAAATAYVALSKGPVDLSGLAGPAPAGGGPRVLAFADHFQLGEPVLPSVLRRWKRGLPVEIVGLVTGSVRLGIRREPASPHEERIALEARAKELELSFAGAAPAESDGVRRLGIDVKGATVFVLRADGTILARASGRSLDPRPLDAVVVPLAPAAAPEK